MSSIFYSDSSGSCAASSLMTIIPACLSRSNSSDYHCGSLFSMTLCDTTSTKERFVTIFSRMSGLLLSISSLSSSMSKIVFVPTSMLLFKMAQLMFLGVKLVYLLPVSSCQHFANDLLGSMNPMMSTSFSTSLRSEVSPSFESRLSWLMSVKRRSSASGLSDSLRENSLLSTIILLRRLLKSCFR